MTVNFFVNSLFCFRDETSIILIMKKTQLQGSFQKKTPLIKRIATIIVDCRVLIFLLFAAAAVFCVLSIGKVKINSELTTFLSPTTDTRRGLTIMEEEFTDFTTFEYMVSGITYEKALTIANKIADLMAK